MCLENASNIVLLMLKMLGLSNEYQHESPYSKRA